MFNPMRDVLSTADRLCPAMTCQDVLARLPPMPKSTQGLVCLLEEPRTTADLTKETGLARRTVYVGLNRLRALGVLREQVSLRDSRQTYFWIEPDNAT